MHQCTMCGKSDFKARWAQHRSQCLKVNLQFPFRIEPDDPTNDVPWARTVDLFLTPRIPRIPLPQPPQISFPGHVALRLIGGLRRAKLLDPVVMSLVELYASYNVIRNVRHGVFACGLCYQKIPTLEFLKHGKECLVKKEQELREWTFRRTVGF